MNAPVRSQELVFEYVAQALQNHGLCVLEDALPEGLGESLLNQCRDGAGFVAAGVGRGPDNLTDQRIRSDSTRWITGETTAEQTWNQWLSALQQYLNRRLFLGLFSVESHFAHYAPGAYYERHLDAFIGKTNRVLTLVTYLNADWQASDGGELVIYKDADDNLGQRVLPQMGTVVIFLSEEFPHEVLPAKADRYSIAGWFRVNASINGDIDPPR